MIKKKILVIFGPTSSGKSKKALKVAAKYDSTIINADSLQVYKDLKIITSRPSLQDEEKVLHKLYGVLDGSKNCSLALWLTLAKKEIEQSLSDNKLPIIVGGTGMYIKGLIEGISQIPLIPSSIQIKTKKIIEKKGINFLYSYLKEINKNLTINPNDKQRIQRAYNVFIATNKTIEDWNLVNKKIINDVKFDVVITEVNRDKLYLKSENRFDQMIDQGAIEEVKNLLSKNYDLNSSLMKAIGVREIRDYLNGDIDLNRCKELSKQKTRNYIKRQLTWIKSNNIIQNTDFKKYM